MRLEKLKLAGFKSFVDPTTIQFPSHLIGIVGPNGCGKSNIIDAVRWVMGESSAKQLRGESISDVIFNGSAERKPVGQASIELVFDNSDGKIGGEYAKFNQISIRRLVTRDAQSTYFLNGTKVRRKDITDVFLGTGLGPRSYSIIEQGVISQLIEAKPDELRSYLEEVAGISKYKERRRETENRIKHTRENLSRINDIREELDKQLHHLNRQAKNAERYKVLKEEERLLKAQLIVLKWQLLDEDLSRFSLVVGKQETLLESHRAELQHVDTAIEKLQMSKSEMMDNHNETQGRYFQLGSEISRLEQAIEHQKERKEQLKEDLAQTVTTLEEAKKSLSTDDESYNELQQKRVEFEPQLNLVREREEESQKTLSKAEDQMQRLQIQWDDFNTQASDTSQIVHVEQTKISHLELQQLQANQKLSKIDLDHQHIDLTSLEQELQSLSDRVEKAKQNRQIQQSELDQVNDHIDHQRVDNKKLDIDLNQLRTHAHDATGKLASLEALQQAALGQKNHEIVAWLENQRLHDKPRLAQHLKVESGWEQAVETVLGLHLEAVCIQNVDAVTSVLQSLKHGSVMFLDAQETSSDNDFRKAPLLSSKIQSKWPIVGLLNGLYVADSLSEAIRLRRSLSATESVITKDGLWIGPNWLRVSKDVDTKSGVIQREQEIKTLKTNISQLGIQINSVEQALSQGWTKLSNLEKLREQLQNTLSHAESDYADSSAKLQILRGNIEQMMMRREHLKNESEEHKKSLETTVQDLLTAQSRLQEAKEKMIHDNEDRDELIKKRDESRDVLNRARATIQQHQSELHTLEMQEQLTNTKISTLEQTIERTKRQLESLQLHQQQLMESLEKGDVPVSELKIELESVLEKRVEVESVLNGLKQRLSYLDSELIENNNKRHESEQLIQQVQSELEEQHLKEQTLKVRKTTLEEQLNESQFEMEPILSELPEEATEEAWQETIEKVSLRIHRLGPINLAAIDEFKELSERKTYLDKQCSDLEEALSTLQSAIRKIDRETRSRFKNTFDEVNVNFKKIFPRVFGGGTAYLEMTGEDLLETGVSLMAKPPGKHISSIHQLSGGEKALTAIALVFALFQLNPSPFCMLDEVDAPLDDANVERFCDLVKEMSDKVQFIFISHNKNAIEMSHQLMGVTMKEPGVSRVVAVDMNQAMEMAKE